MSEFTLSAVERAQHAFNPSRATWSTALGVHPDVAVATRGPCSSTFIAAPLGPHASHSFHSQHPANPIPQLIEKTARKKAFYPIRDSSTNQHKSLKTGRRLLSSRYKNALLKKRRKPDWGIRLARSEHTRKGLVALERHPVMAAPSGFPDFQPSTFDFRLSTSRPAIESSEHGRSRTT